MEKVALNYIQLDHLAGTNPKLSGVFYGTVACDRLPKTLPEERPSAFFVNTDPHDEPGTHWIALWTRGNVCEILDSYALPWKAYFTSEPLQEWLDRHFKYLVSNGFAVTVQSKLWWLHFDVPDRPSRRPKYGLFFGQTQEKSWTNVETFDRE